MKILKVLYSGLLAVTMLVMISSCGVLTSLAPTATVNPSDGSIILKTDDIVISFDKTMNTGSLVLSGDIADEGNDPVWVETRAVNDTLIIAPKAFGSGWTAGEHTLVVDAQSNHEVPMATLTLHYTVQVAIPQAVALPANAETIIGSSVVIVLFTVEMDPSTLTISGDMAAQSDGGTWARTRNENDTLVIRPANAWSGSVTTLIINVDSAEGGVLPTLTLTYVVDASVPVVANALPADTSTINGSVPIVITFNIEMNPATLVLGGTLKNESDGGKWSTGSNTNDTLTISPANAWSNGAKTLSVDVKASNSIALSTLTLNYIVDKTLPTASVVSPASGSKITGGENVIINFDKSMDVSTLNASGSLFTNSNKGVWSSSSNSNSNDRLTFSPQTSWSDGPINLTLNIKDIVGNALLPLSISYTVDKNVPGGIAVPDNNGILYVYDDIVITFDESMNPSSQSFAGTLALELGNRLWTKNVSANDTLTISAATNWPVGPSTLDVSAEDVAGNPVTLLLSYTVATDTCSDGQKNFVETDIDCGGPTCTDACLDGKSCVINSDCNSNVCDAGTCTIEAICGNNITTPPEACDTAGDSVTCDADCTMPVCGDSYVNTVFGEQCDTGGESSSCDADCTAVACGDGSLNMSAGEECDDGNTKKGDGCSSTCKIEKKKGE